ncbi:pyrrolo-quinoline quinone [Haloferax sp. Atlit-4N]|uniref:outer membrane protein assembly factor BamB family protein n=1 Tax=Haloferax sp. Atlit-4N TaxID=2077206 RepID=UPI000E24B119|nr:PQQ-binding-like beta-propeller repeat protein [Haloferax sp. Atlit-4N]RDZ50246.1 pyrrolo-quinoline quinone [Haloferax sp. Atlit-4N]
MAWSTRLSGSVIQPPSQPLVDGRVVVQARKFSVTAIDMLTGDEEWQVEVPDGEQLVKPPSLSDGWVYTVSQTTVARIHLETGVRETIHQFPASVTIRTSPLIIDGTIVVGVQRNTESQLIVFDQLAASPTVLSMPVAPRHLAANPDTVYVRTKNTLLAVDIGSWTVQWTHSGIEGGHLGDVPLVWNGTIYTGTGGGYFVAVDGTTGVQQWQTQLPGTHSFSPTVLDETLYTTDVSGTLYQISPETGSIQASDTVEASRELPGVALGNIDQSPVVAGDRVLFVAPDGGLASASPSESGLDVHRLPTLEYRAVAPPTVVRGALFVSAAPLLYGLSS